MKLINKDTTLLFDVFYCVKICNCNNLQEYCKNCILLNEEIYINTLNNIHLKTRKDIIEKEEKQLDSNV